MFHGVCFKSLCQHPGLLWFQARAVYFHQALCTALYSYFPSRSHPPPSRKLRKPSKVHKLGQKEARIQIFHIIQGIWEDIRLSLKECLVFSPSQIHFRWAKTKLDFQFCSVFSMSSKEAKRMFLIPWTSVCFFSLHKSTSWAKIKLDFQF